MIPFPRTFQFDIVWLLAQMMGYSVRTGFEWLRKAQDVQSLASTENHPENLVIVVWPKPNVEFMQNSETATVNLLSTESSSENLLLGCEIARERLRRLQSFHQSLVTGRVLMRDRDVWVLTACLPGD
jgi:hypothetical protein